MISEPYLVMITTRCSILVIDNTYILWLSSFIILTVKGNTAMSIPFKKNPLEFRQRALFATNVFDLLLSDHPCFVYEDIFKQLETSSVEQSIFHYFLKKPACSTVRPQFSKTNFFVTGNCRTAS